MALVEGHRISPPRLGAAPSTPSNRPDAARIPVALPSHSGRLLCKAKHLTIWSRRAILFRMATIRPQPEQPPEPSRLGSRAASDLRFIRETMESAGSFTAVPGRGGVAMGLVGLAAAAIAALLPGPDTFLWVWLGAAGIALSLGGLAMARKAVC